MISDIHLKSIMENMDRNNINVLVLESQGKIIANLGKDRTRIVQYGQKLNK